jgi:hypothetical protein
LHHHTVSGAQLGAEETFHPPARWFAGLFAAGEFMAPVSRTVCCNASRSHSAPSWPQACDLPHLYRERTRSPCAKRPAGLKFARVGLAIALLAAPVLAIAQGSGADAGSTLWSAMRSILYGPWGLVGSAVVVAIGIYMFLERGFMHALGVMVAGALIFFVPLIVVSMRNAAQALGGAG